MENIQLRKATSEDLMLLFKWVNDPLVRENSFNSKLISLEEHKIWFKNSMLDKNKKIFILTKEDKQTNYKKSRKNFVGRIFGENGMNSVTKFPSNGTDTS